MRLRVAPRVLAVLLVAVAAVGCDGGARDADDGRLPVVATTTHLTDLAGVIGGDRVRVTGILGANVDAHDYEPSPADLDAIARAAVLVENGFGLEAWLADTVEAAGFEGTRVTAAEGVTPIRAGDAPDPHIWHDVANAKVMVANIARGLADADPEGAATYQANLARYTAELDKLDAEIRAAVATVPEADRKLVTSHESFAYYARAYGFEVVGSVIPSFDSAAELSAREVADLVARIRATGTKAVFSEASLPPDTAETIGREAGVKVVAGEDALYGDSLGPAGSPAATYLAMMRHNTNVIVSALR